MLSHTHPNFQAKINLLATLTGRPAETIYELWRRYDRECAAADQSPLLCEFVLWYRADLGGEPAQVNQWRDALRNLETEQAQ